MTWIKILAAIDLIFLALPHGIAISYVPKMIKAGKKVVDLGADYRFHDEAVFKKWYKLDHPDKAVLAEAVFGLPELYKEEIKKARLIGNPGCYPTASILGLAPLVKNKLIDAEFDRGRRQVGRFRRRARRFAESPFLRAERRGDGLRRQQSPPHGRGQLSGRPAGRTSKSTSLLFLI